MARRLFLLRTKCTGKTRSIHRRRKEGVVVFNRDWIVTVSGGDGGGSHQLFSQVAFKLPSIMIKSTTTIRGISRTWNARKSACHSILASLGVCPVWNSRLLASQ